MVIKNLENKIKLVMIVSCLFMVGCIIISLGSIFTAKGMVDDAHKKVYVLDGNVPILVQRTTMDETLSTTSSSPSRLMTSTSTIRWRRPCIWSMRQDWLSIMP